MAGPNEGGGAPQTTDTTYPLGHLSAIGTIPGVRIDRMAGKNGPGAGRIRATGEGKKLSWRAPGSATFGGPVDCATDGTYQLIDGVDADKFIEVEVYAAYLWVGDVEADVFIADVYNNIVGSADVIAAEATAGDVSAYIFTITNNSGSYMEGIVGWLDASVADMEISNDGAAWSAPTTEGTGVSFADIAPAGTRVVHLRRTIAASTPADPRVLNIIKLAFTGT